MNKTISTIAILTAMSACGGSKTGNVKPIEAKGFAEVEALVEGSYSDYMDDIQNGNFTGAEDLPVSGSADYQGVIGIGRPGLLAGTRGPAFLGQLSVNIEFDSGDVNGIADNFYNSFSNPGLEIDADGTLSASIGDDGRMTGTFTGQFNSFPKDEDSPFQFDIQAGFVGGGTEVFSGTGTGAITSEGDVVDAEVIFGGRQD